MKFQLVKTASAGRRGNAPGGAIPGGQDARRRRRTASRMVTALLMMAGLVHGIGDDAGVSAQQAPPPAVRTLHAASIPVSGPPRQYDLVQMLLELAPGAEVPSHRVNGKAII